MSGRHAKTDRKHMAHNEKVVAAIAEYVAREKQPPIMMNYYGQFPAVPISLSEYRRDRNKRLRWYPDLTQ